jgi:ATP-dependent RNA helicase DDX3X
MILTRARFTVIDEADELLSTGWEEAMEKLFQGSGTLQSFCALTFSG